MTTNFLPLKKWQNLALIKFRKSMSFKSLYPMMKMRVEDCKDRKQRVAKAIWPSRNISCRSLQTLRRLRSMARQMLYSILKCSERRTLQTQTTFVFAAPRQHQRQKQASIYAAILMISKCSVLDSPCSSTLSSTWPSVSWFWVLSYLLPVSS